jgi:hypothetical protein
MQRCYTVTGLAKKVNETAALSREWFSRLPA